MRARVLPIHWMLVKDQQLQRRAGIFNDIRSTNEVFMILDGVRAVLEYFLELGSSPASEESFWLESDEGVLDSVLEAVTFGLVRREAEEKLIVKV
jgi:hypothetical protein